MAVTTATLRAFLVALALLLCASVTLDAQTAPVATVGLTPGWATFGQALPQGAATGGLQVGTLPTQTDVKNTWPDGSIRFAIVTVKATTAGGFAIAPAPPSTGRLVPGLPTATVALTIDGVVYTATLPPVPASDLWLSGPLVYEGRSIVAPASSADGPGHPFLRVIFDTRVFNDGGARVDVTVENTLDVAGAATTTYDVAIAVNGASVFTQTGVEHFYLTRWRKVFAAGTTVLASVTPDVAAFNRAKALPAFVTSAVTNVVSVAGGPNFDILKSGALDPIMSDHGGRAELAPLPDWTARYLVHKDPAQRAFVLANGDLAGSWPVHVRESDTGSRIGLGSERLVSLDERPNLWLDGRAQGGGWDYIAGTPMPMREYGSDIAAPGQSPLLPDNAHQPSIAFVPYLLTGDRYYAEEMAFWANYGMVRTYPGDGIRASQGILANNEVRGFGWALRNLADAAAYYPDGSPVKAYLSQKVTNNLEWLDAYARSQDPIANPFQILWVNRRPDGGQFISLWEQTYVAHAIDRAVQHGFVGGLAHRDAIARFHLKLFTSEPDYPRAQAGAYLVAIGPPNPSSPAAFGGTYFGTMAEIWSGTAGQERPFAGFYGPEARLNLIYAVQNGWPGAQAAYDYLWPFLAATPTGCVTLGGATMPDLTCRAGWALDFPSRTTAATAVPAQIASPAAGSTLSSGTQILSWNAGVGVLLYQVTVGTAPGANDLYSGPQTTNLSATVAGLPANGSRIWVRLSSLSADGWLFTDASYLAAGSAPAPGTPAAPAKVGGLIAGTFKDATGHSAQSHLVYAPNAGVWWLFTLSSAHDSFGDHTVQSYYSSGANLATATWTAAAPSPHLANTGLATDSVFAGGRSLGAAVLSAAGADYAHVFASAAFDGQVSSNGHIRARLGKTSIAWEAWNNPGSPNSASEWEGPASSGLPPSAASTHSSWGNVVGVSTGGFIHHSSVTMDQEVDCNVGRSTNADVAAVWSNGFGANAVGASPPNTTAVIDKSMIFQCKSLAFAPLAANVMLAVYSNGAVAQPNLTNLRFQRSGANGTWANVSTSGGGNGNVFSSDATIDANDWALVPVTTSAVYAFRRNASGTAIQGVAYVAGSNSWSSMSPAPPLFGVGQASKSGAGVFGATDGTNIWLFAINTDSANSILYSKFNGAVWTSWTTVPGTGTGTQTRNFISGYPRVAAGQIGLIWTEGTTTFDVLAAALDTDDTSPLVSITAPQNGATVSGPAVTVLATASDNNAVAGVQFKLDGVDLGAELTSGPYTITWNASAVAGGTHTLTAVARDAAGNQTTSTPVSVTVPAATPPDTVAPTVSATPAPGTFTSAQSVTLVASEVATIYYTVDGSAPAASSTQYLAPIAITSTKTIRYLVVDAAGNSSSGALPYTIAAAAPGPLATAPAPSIVKHSTLTTTAVAVTLTWSAAAGASGSAVKAYELQQSTDGGMTWTPIALPTALTTSIARTIVPSATTAYVFRVRATDVAGGVGAFAASAPFTVAAVQESDPDIVYGGAWPIAPRANAFGGSTSSSSAAGSTARYSFSGSYVAWITEKDPTHGQTVVSIDGVAGPMIDNYNSGSLTRRAMFVQALPAGRHTIELKVLATRNAAATGTRTDLDTFIVFGAPAEAPAPGSATLTAISAAAVNWPSSGNATVTVSSAAGVPAGNVSLTVDGAAAATQPLVNGVANFTIPGVTVGTHTLTAGYAAQGGFEASNATASLQVNRAPTTITIDSPAVAQPADGTVTVTVASPGATPSGCVSLSVDGGAPAMQALVAGAAVFSVPRPTAGTHALTAGYAAQETFAASSATGMLVVTGTAPPPGPVATPPAPSIVNHSTLTTTAVPVTLTWSAAAAAGGSAVKAYEVQQSTDGGATWTPIALPTALTTSVVRTLVPSPATSYVFRVRATDVGGSVGAFATSAPFTVAAAQESDPSIAYAGAWPVAARANAFGGSTSSTSVAGSTARYTFTGSYVAWVTEKDPNHGQVVVSIDGVAGPMIDNYNSGSLTRRVMFVRALPPGTHTIEVKVLATKSAAATGTRTDIDTFIVFGAPAAGTAGTASGR